MNEISFTKVKLPYGWLGNMAPFPITFQELVWPTTEHLFQALRFPFDSPVREEIRMQIGPMQAKFVAKRNVGLMTTIPRSQVDLDTMELVLQLKLEQHSALKQQLLATGELPIIEDVTSRPNESGLFWGARRSGRPGEEIWVGKNMLGLLWMKARSRLQNPHGFDLTD